MRTQQQIDAAREWEAQFAPDAQRILREHLFPHAGVDAATPIVEAEWDDDVQGRDMIVGEGPDRITVARRIRRAGTYRHFEWTIRGPNSGNNEVARLARGQYAPYYLVMLVDGNDVESWMLIDVRTLMNTCPISAFHWGYSDRPFAALHWRELQNYHCMIAEHNLINNLTPAEDEFVDEVTFEIMYPIDQNPAYQQPYDPQNFG